ncbi:MAG: FixH family protein [Nitrospinota bacterium]|nr:FixH family protein [Nitrospinota bacterium]
MNELNSEKNWPENKSPLKSPWVRGILLLMFLFFSVNIFMAWIAFNSKPNLVAADYYSRGQSFTERTRQKNISKNIHNWDFSLIHPDVFIGKPSLFKLSITSNGRTIQPDKVTFLAYRPSDSAKDFKLSMESSTDGINTANITFMYPGNWDIIIVAEHAGYEADFAERIVVRAP